MSKIALIHYGTIGFIMKKSLTLLWLLLCVTTSQAQLFEPPVIIEPANPKVGDTIRVGLFVKFFPPCLILPAENQDGLTHIFEFENNDIDLFVVNSLVPPICNPFPISPAPREYYELGILESGTYTLSTTIVSVVQTLPVPPNTPPLPNFGPTFSFQVMPEPRAINTFTNIGSLALILLMLLASHLFYRKYTR